MNQQGAQGDITLLADGAELRLAAAGILPWRQDNSTLAPLAPARGPVGRRVGHHCSLGSAIMNTEKATAAGNMLNGKRRISLIFIL